jgi:fructokinase
MRSRKSSRARCVGTGFIVLDIIRSVLDKSTTLERRHAGGSCGNVLAILSYLGVAASAVGRIGDDPVGDELVADLRRWRVDVQLIAVEHGRRTPVIIQESFTDARGRARHRFSRACPACGAAMPGYRPLLATDVAQVAGSLPAHTLFFFDRVSPGTLELARRSREQGALVLFEPSGIRDEELFLECLRASHVLKYSHDRLSGIGGLVKRSEIPVEIETLGAGGLRYRMRRSGRLGEWQHLPAFAAPTVRDTAGSGDWCTAGLLAQLAASEVDIVARAEDARVVREGLRFGQALAALNCCYDGARGLMYVVGHSGALRAAGRLLEHSVPKLPSLSSPPAAAPRSDATGCVVCASDLHPVHA